MTASATDPLTKLVADPQDPLPESNWKYRRRFAFVALALYAVLRGFAIWHTREASAWGLDLVCFAIIVCYMIAPSGEQAVKMIQTVSALKGGVSFNTTSAVDAAAGTATTTTEATAEPTVKPTGELER
jgi:hypothetical protein